MIAKLQRIGSRDAGVEFDEAAGVGQLLHVLLVTDGEVIAAVRADEEAALESVLVSGLATLLALAPDTFRDLALDPRKNSGLHSLEPIHVSSLLAGRIRPIRVF